MSRIPTPVKAPRSRTAATRIQRDARITERYIAELLEQQQAILDRHAIDKQIYLTEDVQGDDHPKAGYYGVPRAVLASNEAEARALVTWYQEPFKDRHGVRTGRCHQIARSY